MTNFSSWTGALGAAMALLFACGCDVTGKVQQGRVIAYDQKTGTVTLIAEAPNGAKTDPGVLPPVSVRIPEDPDEMGPTPVPGKLIRLDTKARQIVIFDSTTQTLRTLEYTPVAGPQKATKAPKSLVDRVKKTITLYSKDQQVAITCAASDDLLALPDDTWRSGDVVRYYYKTPEQAMRLMNVTRTDLSKSGE